MKTKIMNFIEQANKVLFFTGAIAFLILIGTVVYNELSRNAYEPPSLKIIEQNNKINEALPQINYDKVFKKQIKDVYVFELRAGAVIHERNAEIAHFSGGYSDKNSANEVVNLIFVKQGQASELLFESNRLILDFDSMRSANVGRYNSTYSLSRNLYSVVQSDSNNDGLLNDKDSHDLYVSDYDGSHLTMVR